jgi:hypothetical protein
MLLCVLAGTGFGDDAPEPVIRSGDFILAKGKVRNCEDWGEFVVAYGYVAELQVSILDHVLPAAGLRPSEFEASLRVAVKDRIGRRPKTLRIEVLNEVEFVTRQSDIEANIESYHAAIKACDRKMDEFMVRAKDVA